MTILSDENPPLTLYQLSHEATMYDVYDALELLEFKKYLNRIKAKRAAKTAGEKVA